MRGMEAATATRGRPPTHSKLVIARGGVDKEGDHRRMRCGRKCEGCGVWGGLWYVRRELSGKSVVLGRENEVRVWMEGQGAMGT